MGNMSFTGRIGIKLSELSDENQRRVREAMQSPGTRAMLDGGQLVEVMSYGSCKLVARRLGAVVRYSVSHYGYYPCCAQAEVKLAGHALQGEGKETMPIWAVLQLIENGPDWFCSLSNGEIIPDGWSVISWVRHSEDLIFARVLDTAGFEWRARLHRKGDMTRADHAWWPTMTATPNGSLACEHTIAA